MTGVVLFKIQEMPVFSASLFNKRAGFL